MDSKLISEYRKNITAKTTLEMIRNAVAESDINNHIFDAEISAALDAEIKKHYTKKPIKATK